MLDFLTLQTTATNPSIISIIYTVMVSFLLSSLIALTYEKLIVDFPTPGILSRQ